VTWLFEPESYSPMAKVVGGKHYSIVSDHRGIPLAMFDAEGRERWSAQIDIYGRLTKLVGESAACPFRFSGQYEDTETELYYNRHRYYDPDSGIYCSQDPIGLAGGLRPYAYVPDPMVWYDPLGLAGDCTPALKKGDPLPDNAVIHRIGGGTADNLTLKPPEKKLTPPGISVLRAESAEAASQMAKDVAKEKGWSKLGTAAETMGSAKVSDIRAAGFDVIHDPTATWGDAHARLIHPEGEKGFTPENLDRLSKAFENKSGL
jgi:RHS repeat-associated protein